MPARSRDGLRGGGGGVRGCDDDRGIGLFCLGYQISTGVGTWAWNHPVAGPGTSRTSFSDRIGHAGTLNLSDSIPAAQMRTSINRSAEAMDTVCGDLRRIFRESTSARVDGLVPGSVYQITMVSGRTSAARLLWDVFAVSTYFTVSVLFWYTGLIPDLGTLRDRARRRSRSSSTVSSPWAWRGSNRNWRHMKWRICSWPSCDAARSLRA